MTIVHRFAACALVALGCLLAAGCQNMPKFSDLPEPELPDFSKLPTSFAELRHNLQPHRLHMLNRHSPPNRSTNW